MSEREPLDQSDVTIWHFVAVPGGAVVGAPIVNQLIDHTINHSYIPEKNTVHQLQSDFTKLTKANVVLHHVSPGESNPVVEKNIATHQAHLQASITEISNHYPYHLNGTEQGYADFGGAITGTVLALSSLNYVIRKINHRRIKNQEIKSVGTISNG